MDAVTPSAPKHKPVGWSALHMLANRMDPWRQRGRLAQTLLDRRADPMRLTARHTTPLHTAAATNGADVADVLLAHPDIDVNFENKDNKTPWDVQSKYEMKVKIENAEGRPGKKKTGKSSRDEVNARQRGGPAPQSRVDRARTWRESL